MKFKLSPFLKIFLANKYLTCLFFLLFFHFFLSYQEFSGSSFEKNIKNPWIFYFKTLLPATYPFTKFAGDVYNLPFYSHKNAQIIVVYSSGVEKAISLPRFFHDLRAPHRIKIILIHSITSAFSPIKKRVQFIDSYFCTNSNVAFKQLKLDGLSDVDYVLSFKIIFDVNKRAVVYEKIC